MASALPVLIVSAEASHRDRIAEVARKCGLRPVYAPSLADARIIIAQSRFSMIFCGDDLPDSNLLSSLQCLAAAKVPVIVLSHRAEWSACLEALSFGAFDYIACPPHPVETERILRLALGNRTLDAVNSAA